MMFWGVEVKSGENVVVQPGKDMLLHVSQACLGGIKKDKESQYVQVYAKKDGKKLQLGILSPEKFPHVNFDLVYGNDFGLCHDGKHVSVHFAGYKVPNPHKNEEENESDDSEGELVPMKALENDKSETKKGKRATANPEVAAGKAKVKIVEQNKDAKQNEEDDSDEDDSEENKDVEGESDDDDTSDEDSEDDASDEETPKKPEMSKKRTAEASNKTPGPEKKAKFATPVKNDVKKPVPHVATPHPAKAANKDKSKQSTPKSSGSFACNSCNRSFGSEQGLQSHSKAKHGDN